MDGIVVLGGAEQEGMAAVWGGVQLSDAAERFTQAMALARRFPEARVLFTGGSGRLRDLGSGAREDRTVARRYFAEQGLDPARLVFEGLSRNTAENAAFSLALAAPGEGEVWVLVTSAFHMPRAVRSFESAGWTGIVPWPVDHRTQSFADGIGWNLAVNLGVLEIAVKEYVGLVAYAVRGT